MTGWRLISFVGNAPRGWRLVTWVCEDWRTPSIFVPVGWEAAGGVAVVSWATCMRARIWEAEGATVFAELETAGAASRAGAGESAVEASRSVAARALIGRVIENLGNTAWGGPARQRAVGRTQQGRTRCPARS
ncbi:hypothetical protein MRA01_11250 [Methylobacterium radiotolerans]|nr:hypothetical protein MRA01_11250 [Methylobacterium radiotolerans]